MFQVKMEPDDWLADAPMPPDEPMYLEMVYAYQQQQQLQQQQQMATYQGYQQQQQYNQQFGYNSQNLMYHHHQNQPTTSTNIAIKTEVGVKTEADDDSDLIEVTYDRTTPLEKWTPNTSTMNDHKYWASVYYYENDKRVGGVFNTSENVFLIDGATCKWGDNRMSISSTPLSASKKASDVRNQFGAGIRIWRENGKVKLTCLTQSPIFVQCPQRAMMHGEVANMVYRLQTLRQQSEMTIFDEEYFDKLLHQRKHLVNEDFYMLHNHCITRISFIKGFGSDYPRTVITETPCWVEVHMNHKLREFDRVLKSAISELTETLDEE